MPQDTLSLSDLFVLTTMCVVLLSIACLLAIGCTFFDKWFKDKKDCEAQRSLERHMDDWPAPLVDKAFEGKRDD